jgi:hypothetical protein
MRNPSDENSPPPTPCKLAFALQKMKPPPRTTRAEPVLSLVGKQRAQAQVWGVLHRALPGDMDFADFGAALPSPSDVAKRHYASPDTDASGSARDADDTNTWIEREIMERETGFEPATLSLGTFRSGSIKNRLTG